LTDTTKFVGQQIYKNIINQRQKSDDLDYRTVTD